jgi:hypothetical protein
MLSSSLPKYISPSELLSRSAIRGDDLMETPSIGNPY